MHPFRQNRQFFRNVHVDTDILNRVIQRHLVSIKKFSCVNAHKNVNMRFNLFYQLKNVHQQVHQADLIPSVQC